MQYLLAQCGSFEIKKAISASVIALAFVKNSDETYAFIGSHGFTREVEKYFETELLDELSFFSPTGKAGELFEIPVSVQDAKTERIFLVGAGDQSLAAQRLVASAIARKVRGKKIDSFFSMCNW